MIFHGNRESLKPDTVREKHLQRGSSIVEGVLCMLMICLILFGLLQIFLLYTTQEMTEYVSFRTARSLSVGFADELTVIEARARAVPVSGTVLQPSDLRAAGSKPSFTTSSYRQNNGVYDYFYRLRQTVLRYMEGVRYMECEYWQRGSSNSHGVSSGDNIEEETYLQTGFTTLSDRVISETGFKKYPLRLPFAQAFLPERQMDLIGKTELKNHAEHYLED